MPLNRHLLANELGEDTRFTDEDRTIIRYLQRDGRISYAEIARRLGLSEKVARARTQRLIDCDLVKITTVTDPALLGYSSLAMLGIVLSPGYSPSKVAEQIAQLPMFDHLAVTLGRYDIAAEAVCRDITVLASVIDHVNSMDGVAHIETSPYLELLYQAPYWDEAQRGDPEMGLQSHRDRLAEGQSPRVDELDWSIIQALNADGRTPFREMARSFDVSEGLIRQRYAKLIGSSFLRVMAITNPLILGYRMMAWLAIRVEPRASRRKVAASLAENEDIAYVAITGGVFDIWAEAACKSEQDLLRLLDDDLTRVSGLASVESLTYVDLYYKVLRVE